MLELSLFGTSYQKYQFSSTLCQWNSLRDMGVRLTHDFFSSLAFLVLFQSDFRDPRFPCRWIHRWRTRELVLQVGHVAEKLCFCVARRFGMDELVNRRKSRWDKGQLLGLLRVPHRTTYLGQSSASLHQAPPLPSQTTWALCRPFLS